MVAVISNGDGDDDEEDEEGDAEDDGDKAVIGENAEAWTEVDGISNGRCVGSGG